FSVALLLASTVATDSEVIAKQQLGGLGSARGVPQQIRPTFTQSAPTALGTQLPNGASSISEMYGSWTVDCRLADGQQQCRLLQRQSNSTHTQKRVVQVRRPEDGTRAGTNVLPLGLKLDFGSLLKLDDGDLDGGRRFLTCVPAGCLLPVSFSMTGVDAMKNGK